MVYICVGMVIGRQVLNSRKVAFVLLGAGPVLAVATWVLSIFLLGPAGGLQRLIESSPGMTRTDIEQRLLEGPDGTLMPDTTW